jgi:probable rRNA maturation factor
LPQISFHNADVTFRCPHRRNLRSWLIEVAHNQGFTIESVSIIFCSDAFLLDLNRTHLQHDYYTDIITFDDSTPEGLRGELYISIPRVRENADQYSPSFTEELHRVMVHGLLHLCGHKDKTPSQEAAMRKAENDMLLLRTPYFP